MMDKEWSWLLTAWQPTANKLQAVLLEINDHGADMYRTALAVICTQIVASKET